jgi:TonB-dependent starch-binding outer membrane protein SusC
MKMKRRLRQLVLGTFVLLAQLPALAQQKTVTGRVTDEAGRGVAGATVSIRNKTIKTTTGDKGDYAITANSGDMLVFSSVGFTEYEERVGSGDAINVVLGTTATNLNEVVVVGYGTLQKKEVTGSVVTIKTANLPQTANTSINNLLQGRAAGLNLDLRSAQPGGRLNVNIRGQGTPLYVIDGVPLFNNRAAEPAIVSFGSTVETGFNGGIDRDPLSTINPSDIESIDVLKDASATAIYGSAASNGVILITTKKGKANNRVNTEYRGSYTFQTAKKYFDLLNAKEFMQQQTRLAKDKFLYDNNLAPYGTSGANPVFTPVFSQAQIDAAGEGTDWLDMMMRDGSINEQNLSVSGGNDRTRIYSSVNYYDNKAIVHNSDFTRFSGRVNIEQKISERIKLTVNMTMSQVNSNNASTGNGGQSEKYNSLQAAYAFAPTVGVYDANGRFTKSLNTLITNPAAYFIIKDKLRTNRFFAAPNLEVKVTDKLKVNVVAGIDKTSSDRKFFLPVQAANYLFPDGLAQLSTQLVANFSGEGYASYSTSFGEHNISLVGGGGYYKSFTESSSMQGVGFFTDALGYNNIGLATNRDKTLLQSFRSPDVIKISQFFRVNYSYKSKYVLTINARNDGSSSFAENKKWGFFPGVSAAWRITEESFMARNKVISELKLRVGYGTVGNDAGLNALALYSNGGGNFLIGNTFYPSVALSQLANPDLSWETIRSANIGIDYGLWQGRITGTIDLFRRDRLNILTTAPLPANNAVNTLNVNLGSQRSEGIEFAINSVNMEGKKFRWETSFNISNYNNRWLKRSPYTALQPYQNATDRTDVVYGWKTNGIIQSAATRPAYMPNGRLGNIIYVDQNKDNLLNVQDVVKLGYSTPKWSFGLGNRFSFMNFDLDVFMYGKLKQFMSNNLSGFYTPARIAGTDGQNTLANIKNVWSNDNTGGTLPGIASNPYNGSNPSGTDDFYQENVSYLRLRNITLGYTFKPRSLLRSARVFVDMQNVALWTNYKGYDPEIAVGNEGNPYPQALSTTIGVNLSF